MTNKTVKFVTGAFSKYEHGDSPVFAAFEVDEKFIFLIEKIINVCKKNGLIKAYVPGKLTWGPKNVIDNMNLMDCKMLVSVYGGFSFTDYPKYANYDIESRGCDIKYIKEDFDSAKHGDVIYMSDDNFVEDSYLKDINSSAVETKYSCIGVTEAMQPTTACQSNDFAVADGKKLPDVGVFVSARIDGSVLSGIVTKHCTKDGKPVFHFEYNYHAANGDVVKGLKWAWPDQIVNSDDVI